MSEPGSIFRAEALEFRARGRETPGGVLRLRPRWLRLSFWLLLALLVAGVILAAVVHASTSSTGVAVVDARSATFSALVPAATPIGSARSAYVDVPGGRVGIDVLAARLIQPDGISRGGLPPAAQASILLSGRVTSRAATRHRFRGASRVAGHITVVLQKRTVGGILVRQFEDLLQGFGGA